MARPANKSLLFMEPTVFRAGTAGLEQIGHAKRFMPRQQRVASLGAALHGYDCARLRRIVSWLASKSGVSELFKTSPRESAYSC